MRARRLFAVLARLYPPPSRAFTADMIDFMTARHARAVRERRRLRFWIDLGSDTLFALSREWVAYLLEEVGRMGVMDIGRIAVHESGLRFLKRRKAAAAMVVATLALALAANNIAFAVVDAFLLSSFGIRDSDRVMVVTPKRDLPGVGSVPFAEAYPNYRTLRETPGVFEEVAAIAPATFSWDDGQEAVALTGARVTASFFATTALPELGRAFEPVEEGPSPAPVAVISHALWQNAFAGDPQVIGRTLSLDGTSHEIVGVMPPGFVRPLPSDVWLPFDLPATQWERILGARSLTVYGRLAPGVSRRQADAEMRAFTELTREATPDNEGFTYELLRLREQEMPQGDRAVLFVQVASLLLLLLAVVNLVVVLIAWGVDRRQEMSVRVALGAGSGRIAMGLLCQGVAIVLAAAAGGLAIASAALPAIRGMEVPSPVAPYLALVGLDARLFGFGILVAALAGLAASAVPAWLGRKAAIGDSLRQGSRSSGMGPAAVRVQQTMLTLQATFTVVLLASAALLGLSFRNLDSVPAGFTPEGRVVARVQIPVEAYPTHEERVELTRRIAGAMLEQPEIARWGFTTVVPLGDVNNVARFVATPEEADPSRDPPPANLRRVSTDYLGTMGIPLLAGRAFDEGDDASGALVAVVSRSLADRLWPGADPVGRALFRAVPGAPPQQLEVVGVAGDVVDGGFNRPPGQTVYVPFAQQSTPRVSFVIEARSSLDGAVDGFRSALRAAAPGLAAGNIVSLESIAWQANLLTWLQSTLLSAFAVIALCIALLGTYGVMSQIVASRQRDHALRLVFGAVPSAVAAAVLRSAALVTVPGIVLGVGASWLLSSLLQPLLFGVEDRTRWVGVAVGALMLVLVTVAALPSALRAARVRIGAAIGSS